MSASRFRWTSGWAAALSALVLAAACTRSPAPEPTRTTTPSPVEDTPTPSAGPPTATASASANGAPVVLIVLENHEASAILGSSDAPFFNDKLVAAGRLFTNYSAVAHPSLPNYLAMTAGDTLGKSGTDSIDAGELSSDNLFHQLSTAGVDWAAYEETMPSPCFRGTSAGNDPATYELKHDPAMAFANVANTDLCRRVVPFSDLQPSSLPAFAFITPNECNDMHSCDVATGDRWLSSHVPPLLAAGAIVVLTFDEGTTDSNGGGNVVLLEIGPGIPARTRDATAFDHYSLLAALEDRFGVPRLGDAASAAPLPL